MKSIPRVVVFFMASIFLGSAQSLTTTETKVVLVVNGDSEKITHIELFNTFQKMKQKEVYTKYADAKFYIGLLEGSYTLKEKNVMLGKGAIITIYTNRRFFPRDSFVFQEHFVPGDRLELGKTMAKVISNKKGELILKTQ
ncbi:hypothetical protein [Eudoraea sp.]|uniref:hypothetical protein n=2 Tax=Eudoraea sp. TaxID=1979955 RepID=UPI003C77931B